MDKQKLAQNRNYFKFVLAGLNKSINKESLTDDEKSKWEQILKLRLDLLKHADINSRLQGLNIPEHRCIYCRKEAKHKITDEYGDIYWLCNKHFKNE